jgi:ferredoxin-NADP reductase
MTSPDSGRPGDTTITVTLGANSVIPVTETSSQSTIDTGWRAATVVSIKPENPTAKTFRLRMPEKSVHLAGQHCVIRLTAPDGYTAVRSYSIASPPDGTEEIEITVERLVGGEVSEFLHDEVIVEDVLEVRGPIGGWFVWRGDVPAVLIGGGSGIVPLMAMLRLARRSGSTDLLRVLASVRTPDDLYYPDELPGPETLVIYTKESPSGTSRPTGLINSQDIPDVPESGLVFICGSERFAEAAADLVIASGAGANQLRIEKFGPSG